MGSLFMVSNSLNLNLKTCLLPSVQYSKFIPTPNRELLYTILFLTNFHGVTRVYIHSYQICVV